MTDSAPNAPHAPNRISPEAQALVDRFFAEGSVSFRTSLKSAGTIVFVIALFLLLALCPLWVAPPGTRGAGLAASLGTLGGPIIAAIIWVLVILIPRDRVRVDAEGIAVRREPTVRWEWIAAMDVWTARSRATYRYLAIRLVDDASVREAMQRRRSGVVTLPYLLSPNARTQHEVCTEIARRLRAGERAPH